MYRYEKVDAIKFLNEIDSKTVDLAIVDPPYNMRKAKWDEFKGFKEYKAFMKKVAQNVGRILKPNGSAYFFNTAHNAARLTEMIEQYIRFEQWITWYKVDAAGNPMHGYHNAQETIVWYTNGIEYTFNRDAIRIPYTSLTKQRYKNRSSTRKWDMDPRGALCKDVWEILSERHWHRRGIVGTKKQEHPTVKPVEMIRRIVLASSNKGDIVCDPFVGTGTTIEVCESLGRECWANDLNYHDIVRERMKQERIA